MTDKRTLPPRAMSGIMAAVLAALILLLAAVSGCSNKSAAPSSDPGASDPGAVGTQQPGSPAADSGAGAGDATMHEDDEYLKTYVDTGATLTVYEGQKTMTTSKNAGIWVNGLPLFVYDEMVNHEHIWNANTLPSDTPMTYFDFEGEVNIEIEMPGLSKPVESAVVMPASHGITPVIADGRVSFKITDPGFYTVVYNGSVNKATHIFANPLETDIPDKDDPNVIFIGPGQWAIDAIQLKSDQTLYISGGAVLNSVVVASNAVNVTIRGRGIISNAEWPAHNQPGSYARVPIDISNCKNLVAEGFIIANGNCWNFNSYMTDTAYISNVKIISGRQNGDGFTFQSCKNHTVVDCFARTWDDSLVLKNYSSSTDNMVFERVQIWTDLAQSMEIGYETNKGLGLKPVISNVLFKDITVLYNHHKPVISIHNSDDAAIRNITYQNIVVENAFMQGDNGSNNELIEMHMKKSGWSAERDEYGSIENVFIDGLTVLRTLDGKTPQSRFLGVSDEHMIKNVALKNISILGEKITSAEALKAEVNEFVANFAFDDSASPSYDMPTRTNAPGWMGAKPSQQGLTVVRTPAQTEAEWPEAITNPEANMIKLPDGTNLAEGKPVTAGEVTDVYAVVNAVDGSTTSYWESKGYPAEITINLQATYNVQTVAVCLNPAVIWEPREQTFSVLVSTDGTTFTEAAAEAKYGFDPETGNRVRVDFGPVAAQYVRLIITANSAGKTGGAQAAEIMVFE